jgi:hypothetical protein
VANPLTPAVTAGLAAVVPTTWNGSGPPPRTVTIGGRDAGGPGRADEPYLIGRGAQPELFVPNAPGRFYPAGSYGGPSSANVTLVLDRQVLARVNARLDERRARRGDR